MEQLRQIMRENIMQNRHRLEMQIGRMEALSPLSRLQGGYVYASVNGRPLTKTGQVKQDDEIRLQLPDGEIVADVKETIPAPRITK